MRKLKANDNFVAYREFQDYFHSYMKNRGQEWTEITKVEIRKLINTLGLLLEKLILTEQISLKEAEMIIGDDTLTLIIEDTEKG